MFVKNGDGNVFLCGGYTTAAVCAAPEAANGTTSMDMVPAYRRLMYQCAYMHDIFELDRVALTWKQLRQQDGKPVLSSGRSAGAACMHNDKLMIFGGFLGMMPEETIPGDGNTVTWRTCMQCGAEASQGGGALLECTACACAGVTAACYCSRTCQEKDWKVHKHWCAGCYRAPEQ
jgi:hypothetical protein